VIGELVPGWIGTAEWFGADPPAVLPPAEAAAVAGAAPGRRAEFATGRACARRALARFGVPPVPIPRDPERGPRWPAGFAGSITHCHGYRAAVAARHRDLRSVGIDAEPDLPLPDRVRPRVLLPEELDWCRRQPGGLRYDRVVFSIKESVFKAWHPVTHRWLGFRDARVTLTPASGTGRPAGGSGRPAAGSRGPAAGSRGPATGWFRVALLVPAPACLRPGLTGRYRVAGGLIVTATVVLNDQPT
jgi:4'-phosphopantetheinyl transferase EntD